MIIYGVQTLSGTDLKLDKVDVTFEDDIAGSNVENIGPYNPLRAGIPQHSSFCEKYY